MKLDTLKAGMALLCDSYGKDRTDALHDAFFAVLEPYPDTAFLAACRDWLATERFMPRPVEIKDLILGQLPTDSAAVLLLAARDATIAAGYAARADRLASAGLTAADQAVWRQLVQEPPQLPPPFRDALFYAPRPGLPRALVILADDAALVRSTNPAFARDRERIVARIARDCYAPLVRVAYMRYDALLAALGDDTASDERREA